MELREFFSEDAVQLELQGTSKDEILKELIGLLKLDEKSEGMLFKMLKRRENLGSTGIGRGIAIPHCRSLVVNRLRVAFGRKKDGVDFKAIDDKPVNFFFLIVAPPLEVSNQYLPVLGRSRSSARRATSRAVYWRSRLRRTSWHCSKKSACKRRARATTFHWSAARAAPASSSGAPQ
jgi:mannitol/fructose-specific phosphotransferase system IIA component (Ntr-type)